MFKTAYLKPAKPQCVSPVVAARYDAISGIYNPPKDSKAAVTYNRTHEYFRKSLGCCA